MNPLSGLSGLFGRREPEAMSNEQIAELLRVSPARLAQFSAAYASLDAEAAPSENMFEVNSRQAANASASSDELPADLIERIVAELLADDPHSLEPVSAAEIAALPEPIRPQLSGTLLSRDVELPAYPALLAVLTGALALPAGRERTARMNTVNGMLDIMDLDPVLYAMLEANPTSMSHWLPALEAAVATSGFLRVPETKIVRVPLPILQLTRIDYFELTPTSLEIIDAWARAAFELDESRSYFIKTGTYSAKFDFRNVHVHDPSEVREIGRYLTFVHFQANQMASPLNQPGPIVGVSTTNEWVVREWIEDRSNSPAIYHGMPLRTEFRVFIDADTDEVLAVAPYWDRDLMLERFEGHADSNDPHRRHDAIVFRAHEPTLSARFEALRDVVEREVAAILPALELSGQWSLDIMLNNDDLADPELWAIDMAPAWRSGLSHHVPAGKLKDGEINWMPQIAEPRHDEVPREDR